MQLLYEFCVLRWLETVNFEDKNRSDLYAFDANFEDYQ